MVKQYLIGGSNYDAVTVELAEHGGVVIRQRSHCVVLRPEYVSDVFEAVRNLGDETIQSADLGDL